MRDRPIMEWCIFIMLWLILLWPLSALTGQRAPEQMPVVQQAQEATATWAVMRFSTEPQSFKLQQNGKTIWEGIPPIAQEVRRELELVIHENRVECILYVEWPDVAGLKAVEVSFEPSARESRSCTLWQSGVSNVEVVTFKW